MGSKCKDSSSCDLCNVDLSSIQEQLEHDFSLIHHMKLHQKQKNDIHSCSLCSRDVGTIKSYVSHLHGSKHQEFLTSQRKYWQEKPPTKADLKHRRHVVKIDSDRCKSKQTPVDKPTLSLKNSGNSSRWDRTQPRNASPSSNVGPQNFHDPNKQARNMKQSNFNTPLCPAPGRMNRANTFPRQPNNPKYDRNHPNYSHYNNPTRNYQNPYKYQRNRPPRHENQPDRFYQDWEGNFHNHTNISNNTNPNCWNWQTGDPNASYQNWDKQPGGFWIDSAGEREVNPARLGQHTVWNSNEESCNDANISNPEVNKDIDTPIAKDVPSDPNSNVVASFLTKMRNESDESIMRKNTKKGKKLSKTLSRFPRKLNYVKTSPKVETEPNATKSSVDSAVWSFLPDKSKVELCGQKVKNLNIHLSPEMLDRKVFMEENLKIEPKSSTKQSKSEKLNKKHMFFLSSDSDMEEEPADDAKSTSPKYSLNAIGNPRVGTYNTGLLNRLVNFPCTRKQQAQLASWVQEHSKRKKKLSLPRFNMPLGQQSTDKEEEEIELRKVLSQMMTDLPDDTIEALVEVLKRDNNETEAQEDLELILVPQEEEQRESISEKETKDGKAEKQTKLFNFNCPVPEFQEEEPPTVQEMTVPNLHTVAIKKDPDGPSPLPTNEHINRSPSPPDHQRSDPLPHQEIAHNISPVSPRLLPNSPLVIPTNKSSTPRSHSSEDQRNRISPFCQLPNNGSPHQNSPSHVDVMRGNSLHLESEAVESPFPYPEEHRNQIQINVTQVPEQATPVQIRNQHATFDKGDRTVSPAGRKSSKFDNAQQLLESDEETNCNNRMKKQQSATLFQESSDTIDARSCGADDETGCLSNFTFNNSDLEDSQVQEPTKSHSFNFQQVQKGSGSAFNFQKPQDNDPGPSFHDPSPFLNNPDTTNLTVDDLSPQMSSAAPSNWSEFPSWIKRPSPDPSPSGRRSTGSTKDFNMASGSTVATATAAHSIVDQLLRLSKQEEDLRTRSLRIDKIIIDMYKVLEEWKQKRAQVQQEEVQMRNTRLTLLQELQGSLTKDAPDNDMMFTPPEVSSSNSKFGACSSTTPEAEPRNVTYLGTLDSTWQLIQELGLNMTDEVINSTMPNSEANTGDLMNSFLNPSGSKKKTKNIIKSPAKKKVAKKATKKTAKATGDTQKRKRKMKDVCSELSDKDPVATKKKKKKDNAKIQANILQDLLNHLVKKEVETLRASENRELDKRQTAKAPQSPSSDLSENSEDGIDTPPFQTFAPLEAHDSAVLDIKVSNGFVYTCSVDKTAKRFEIANPENCCVYKDHEKTVSAIQVVTSEKGHDRLFTTSHDCHLRCFDSQSGKLLSEHFTGSSILCIAKGWGKLYLGLNNGEVWPYVVNTSKFLEKLAFSQSSVTKIATGKQGMQRLLCVVTYDGRISVRNADTGLLIRLLETIVRPPCCLLIDGSEVFTTTTDRTILVHDLSSGKLLKSATCDSSATSLHLVGDYVVACSFDGFIRYYQRKTWVLHKMYYGAGKCMTMCMDILNGWVYSGNRHGIIEGFKSDHQTNALCSYQDCRNPIGTWEDLHHHITADHLKNLPAKTILSYKCCPWRNCDFLITGTTAQDKVNVFQDHILQHAIST